MTKLTHNKPSKALQARLASHRLWIESNGEHGKRLNLRGHGNLNGLDLSGVDLRRAILTGGQFVQANLQKADLREAELSLACFNNADLSEADMRGSTIGMTAFFGTKLKKVQWQGVVVDLPCFADSFSEKANPEIPWHTTEAHPHSNLQPSRSQHRHTGPA